MKKYSEPIKKELYALLGRPKLLFKWLTSAGTLISGILTGLGVYLFLDYDLWISITLAFLAPIMVEGFTHIFSGLSVEIFFKALGDEDKKTHWILFVFFSICLLFVGGTNMLISTTASKQTVHTAIGVSKQDTATYSSSKILLNNALDLFVSDSLRALTTANKLKALHKQELQTTIEKAKKEKARIQKTYQPTKWYNDNIQHQKNKITGARSELKKLDEIYSKMASDSIDVARSIMLRSKTVAKIDRLDEDNRIEARNKELLLKNTEAKSNWSLVAILIAILGVLSALLWNIYLHGRNYLCGVKRIYKDNERERNESFMYEFWSEIMNWIDIAKEHILDFVRVEKKSEEDVDVIEDFDNEDKKIIPINSTYEQKEITKLIERTKRQYERRLTSSTQVARVRNESKYIDNANELKRLGYQVEKVKGSNTQLSITQKVRKNNIA